MAAPKKLSPKAMRAECDKFNRAYPVGTRIKVYLVSGEPETVERTIVEPGAYVLSGHMAVVQVSGGGGCWALSHFAGIVAETA